MGDVTAARAAFPPMAALAVDLYGGRRRVGLLRLLHILFWRRGTARALALIRIGQHAYLTGNRLLGRWAAEALRRDYGCFVQSGAQIGPGLQLPHPTGIVIGSGARIGARCTVYHQVTLGGARRGDWQANRYPAVGDDVTLFAGAKLIGAIKVGDGAVVGANAVVNRDVPPRHRAVGIPAKLAPLAAEASDGPPTRAEELAAPSPATGH